jgi:hypothetical protein
MAQPLFGISKVRTEKYQTFGIKRYKLVAPKITHITPVIFANQNRNFSNALFDGFFPHIAIFLI